MESRPFHFVNYVALASLLLLFRPQPNDERQFAGDRAKREKKGSLRKQFYRAIYPARGEGFYGVVGYNARMHQHAGVAVTVDRAGGAMIAGVRDPVQVKN